MQPEIMVYPVNLLPAQQLIARTQASIASVIECYIKMRGWVIMAGAATIGYKGHSNTIAPRNCVCI